jgi:hypothetical protein
MKPEHLAWVDRIWEILDGATDSVLGRQGPAEVVRDAVSATPTSPLAS